MQLVFFTVVDWCKCRQRHMQIPKDVKNILMYCRVFFVLFLHNQRNIFGGKACCALYVRPHELIHIFPVQWNRDGANMNANVRFDGLTRALFVCSNTCRSFIRNSRSSFICSFSNSNILANRRKRYFLFIYLLGKGWGGGGG